MPITHMPAPVDQRRTVVAPAAKRRTGLIPMAPGSQHAIPVVIDGAEQTIICTARHREDAPKASGKFFCLHERCRGKEWATFDAMRNAHPQRSEMAKREEIHVYGIWSDDPQAEGPRKTAEAALKEAEEAHATAKSLLKQAKTIGDKAFAQEEIGVAHGALLAARAEFAKVSGVVGLIAPPDAE